MFPKSLRWMTTTTLAALCGVPLACDRSPSKPVDDTPPEIAATRKSDEGPPPKSNIELGDPLPTMRARAEGGDVGAMVSLGRAYEVLGSATNKAEARKWYQKAADLGNSSAKESLAMMDAAAAAATRPAIAEAPKLAPPPSTVAATTGPSAPVATGPVDLNKLKWSEILASFDNKDFDTASRPNFRKAPTDPAVFIGLTSAPDKTLTAAVSGPDSDNIDAISIVMRVRNRQQIATNQRILQGAAICNTVTRGNVSQSDFLEWVTNYLMSGQKSEPIFRNGWRINVSGTAGEGIKDPKQFLGEAVLIEMKK